MRTLERLIVAVAIVGGLGGSAMADGQLERGETLRRGSFLESANGRFRLTLQRDGNLVLRDQQTRNSLWSTRTNGEGGFRLSLQSDGNLVLYTEGGRALWASDTRGSGAIVLIMQGDGNLVLYARDNRPVWATGTVVNPPDNDPPDNDPPDNDPPDNEGGDNGEGDGIATSNRWPRVRMTTRRAIAAANSASRSRK